MPKVFWFDDKDMERFYGKGMILEGNHINCLGGGFMRWDGMYVIHLNTILLKSTHRTSILIEVLGHEFIHFLCGMGKTVMPKIVVLDVLLDFISYGWKECLFVDEGERKNGQVS